MSLTTHIHTAKHSSQADLDDDGGPKYRIEHSVSNRAGCQRAKCKQEVVKIQKGELRVGTNGFWEREQRWVMSWKHWGCVTPAAIKGVKLLAGDKPEEVPGFAGLSSEAQDQVRLAFEEEKVPDKEFKGICTDLAKGGGGHEPMRNVGGYKIEIASSGRAGCRVPTCRDNGTKILKGELRVGFLVDFDGEHMSWQYKHWNCLTDDEVAKLASVHQADELEGVEKLPEQYDEVVMESLQNGERIDAPAPEAPVPKTKKPPASRKRNADKAAEDVSESSIAATTADLPDRDAANTAHEDSTAVPKGRKKRAAEKVVNVNEDEEVAPRKKLARACKKTTIEDVSSDHHRWA